MKIDTNAEAIKFSMRNSSASHCFKEINSTNDFFQPILIFLKHLIFIFWSQVFLSVNLSSSSHVGLSPSLSTINIQIFKSSDYKLIVPYKKHMIQCWNVKFCSAYIQKLKPKNEAENFSSSNTKNSIINHILEGTHSVVCSVDSDCIRILFSDFEV